MLVLFEAPLFPLLHQQPEPVPQDIFQTAARILDFCGSSNMRNITTLDQASRTHAVETLLLAIAATQRAEHQHVCYTILERAPFQKMRSCGPEQNCQAAYLGQADVMCCSIHKGSAC